MAQVPFFIVDVFAGEEPYSGNPLAVVLEAESLTDRQMQQIAAELHFSETAFVLPPASRHSPHPVRIFTPRQEIPFAGHPTLGTAFVIRSQTPDADQTAISLSLGGGLFTVEYDADTDLYRMAHQAPEFGPTFSPDEIAPMLGIEADAIDPRYPIQEVSTGLAALIVPLTGLAAARRVQLDRARYDALLERMKAKSVLIFTAETVKPDHQVHVRVFGPAYGIDEDPATGSANGNLAAYLAHYRYWGEPSVNIRAEQGMEIDRPSILYLHAQERPDGFLVAVAGRVHPVAYGRWWVMDEADESTGPLLSL